MLSNVKLTHVGELAYFITPPGRGILSSQLTDTPCILFAAHAVNAVITAGIAVYAPRHNASEALYCIPGGSLTTSAVLQLGIDSEQYVFL